MYVVLVRCPCACVVPHAAGGHLLALLHRSSAATCACRGRATHLQIAHVEGPQGHSARGIEQSSTGIERAVRCAINPEQWGLFLLHPTLTFLLSAWPSSSFEKACFASPCAPGATLDHLYEASLAQVRIKTRFLRIQTNTQWLGSKNGLTGHKQHSEHAANTSHEFQHILPILCDRRGERALQQSRHTCVMAVQWNGG